MGNKVLSIPHVVLEDEVGLHFRASNLQRDVLRIIRRWHDAGSPLGLSKAEFQSTFDLVVDVDRHFEVFAKGTGRTRSVDAFEVLMVYVLLSSGEMMEKVDSAFAVFDFAEAIGSNQSGSLNFDEAALMVTAALHGVAKVYEHVKTVLPEAEVLWLCQSMFDMHRIPYHDRIPRREFQEWVVGNPLPRSFVEAFHEPYSLSDVSANVQRRCQRLAAIFNELLTEFSEGDQTVDADQLLESQSFVAALDEPSQAELSELVQLMTTMGPDDLITTERYHAVLRPWHVFNECDVKKRRVVDEKELDLLLWFQLKKRPPAEYAKSFLDVHIDLDKDGQISRLEWVTAAVTAKL